MNLLEVRNLTLRLPSQKTALFEGISFYLKPGEKIALTGPSGSGKTLFLRSLCLLEPHSQGDIRFKGIPPRSLPLYRSQVMYLGQRSSFPQGSVENAFMEAFSFRIHREKIWDLKKTQEALSFFGKPNNFIAREIRQLSGGEKQIVQILRAVALHPQILCLDEPTSALDPSSVTKMETWLKENFSGSWVWVTHQPEQAQRISDQVFSFPNFDLDTFSP